MYFNATLHNTNPERGFSMEITETIRNALKDLIVPELDRIKEESREIKTFLSLTNKRLDDVNVHLADQSRRIDAVREELSQRIDAVREELSQRIDQIGRRMDRLFEVIVRREEHVMVVERVAVLEREVNELKRRLAA